MVNGLSENTMLRVGLSHVSIKTNVYSAYFLDGCSIGIDLMIMKNGKHPLS
jgi:hypothetical protein